MGHGGVCLQLCPVSPAGSGAQLAGGFPGNWASLPVFSWFTAPTLAACLAASCGDLMETVLLRAGLVSFPAAVGGLCFGLLLYLAALQAMGAGSKGGGLPP